MAEKYVDADPRILRAIAHPLRASLLYELYARGSATATTLAEAVDQPVNSVSFHLRQLAKYGLIEDDPESGKERRGDARQRWWRPTVEEGLRISSTELGSTPEGKAALDVFRRNSVARWHVLVDRFFADHTGTEDVWEGNDVPLSLTASEARAMTAELLDVMQRWVEKGRAAASAGDTEGRRTYLALSMLMPHQTDLVD